MSEVAATCLVCACGCGVTLEVEDGKVLKARGRDDHPLSHGFICPKGRALPEIVNAPDRLRTALRRSGAGWQEIGWDEALDEVAARLADLKTRHGAESVAVHVGEAGVGKEFTGYAQRFCQAFGTPNFSHAGAHCHTAKEMAWVYTCGALPAADYARSRCLVFWGCNPPKSYPALTRPIGEALRAGARCIVVDPLVTTLAKRADVHLRIRPGTDGAVALGMLHVVIRDGLYDKQFVGAWTQGFAELAERVAAYPPSRVAEIAWVSPGDLELAAHLYATSGPACISPGIAPELQTGGVQALRALACLEAITGNLDIRGGGLIGSRPPLSKVRMRDVAAPDSPAIGAAEFPAYYRYTRHAQANLYARAVTEEVPYRLRGLVVDAGNPLLSWPGSAAVRSAFQRLQFLAVMDMFMTDTAAVADIVLPAASFLERDELWGGTYLFAEPRIGLARRALDPDGCHTDWELWAGLARRLGLSAHFPWESEMEALDWRLAPLSVGAAELAEMPEGLFFGTWEERAYTKRGFNTPSGKVELWCDRLEQLGFDPLPDYSEPRESPLSRPDLAVEYPLVLTTGAREIGCLHSRFRNIPSLRPRMPVPLVEVHPGAAAALQLSEGQMAAVISPRGRVQAQVTFRKDIDPRVIRVPHGWSEANANLLSGCDPRELDTISGFPACRSLLARLEPAAEASVC
jgi:formate dehydrogenase (coenzyme F420) alpha subunit